MPIEVERTGHDFHITDGYGDCIVIDARSGAALVQALQELIIAERCYIQNGTIIKREMVPHPLSQFAAYDKDKHAIKYDSDYDSETAENKTGNMLPLDEKENDDAE